MINLLLKAKHWQLFTLAFGAMLLFQIINIITLIFNINDSYLFLDGFFILFPVFITIYLLVLMSWIWSVVIGLNKKLPNPLQIKTTVFKLLFFIPIIYLPLFMMYFSGHVVDNGFSIIKLIMPFHFLSMFSIFYCKFQAAKTIKTAETQTKVTFADFAGDFFLIWFFLIGIWVLQPRINQLIAPKLD